MKTSVYLGAALALLLGASGSRAQVVHDPINAAILIGFKSDEMAKWAAQIESAENTVIQATKIATLHAQLNAEIGDWMGVYQKAMEIKLQAANLQKNFAQDISTSFVISTGQGNASLAYTNHGNFAPTGTTNAFGAQLTMDDTSMKRYAAVQNTYESALTTVTATDAEISQINADIADAYNTMATGSTTQAQYDKLKAKVDALQGRLNALYSQRRDAMAWVETQHTINENQKALETKAQVTIQASNDQATLAGFTNLTIGGSGTSN